MLNKCSMCLLVWSKWHVSFWSLLPKGQVNVMGHCEVLLFMCSREAKYTASLESRALFILCYILPDGHPYLIGTCHLSKYFACVNVLWYWIVSFCTLVQQTRWLIILDTALLTHNCVQNKGIQHTMPVSFNVYSQAYNRFSHGPRACSTTGDRPMAWAYSTYFSISKTHQFNQYKVTPYYSTFYISVKL